ncbi:MAG TPA: PQQ-binding-like beta-propeller repeat protein [Mucilaginibacter sp.]|jgi:quinoprotein glucose dehydrogenase|nr:PQQ-binding-like beta-propeller repeat protein [Mucilaginibacter sp.]
MKTRILIFLPAALCLLFSCKKHQPANSYAGWGTYAGTKEGNRYSSNDQITLQNVNQLKVAWTYSSHDKDSANRSQNQCNPIMVDGVLYGTSPKMKLFALDAATGEQKWIFDPASQDTSKEYDPAANLKVCRGVVYWQDSTGGNKRIFYSVGQKTFAVDAENGLAIKSFGKGGYLDLTENLGRKVNNNVLGTTPGIIYKDLLIIGARVDESEDAAPGHVRAYDAMTGKLRWIFHTIPEPGEIGFNTWPDSTAWKYLGSANNWSGMSLDEKRGIVYVPTGSVGGDFYGGHRKGPDLFANCLLALDAATGKYIWHYQVIHHDLWDRDLPANPNLVTIQHNGKTIDAVAQITKHGFIFMFDRTNGQPIFPIVEKPVPTANALPGEQPWPTQPIPTLPQPFARQHFGPEDVTDISPETHKDMLEKYKKVKYNAMFSPPSKDGDWVFPGFDGGGEWGGAAVDPQTKVMYIANSEMPWAQVMIDIPKSEDQHTMQGAGHAIYNFYCVGCHGLELKGNGVSYPSLVDVGKRYNEQQVSQIIASGRNMMPAFRRISGIDKQALLAFLLKIPAKPTDAALLKKEPLSITLNPRNIVPYMMDGYKRFQDKDGYPGIKPPWGTLDAVDLTSGKLLWKVPLGEYPELTKRGIPKTGTELYGGPLVTKGGLVFVAATKDEKIRAFDKKTGREVWSAKLPAAGYATPATYSIDGKQYVVIACGGGKIGSKSGDSYVCFALP